MASNVNFVDVLGETTSIKEERLTKTDHKTPPQMKTAIKRGSVKNKSQLPTLTHWTSNRQLYENEQSTKQGRTAKGNDEVTTESQPSSQRCSMCAFLKTYLKLLEI